MIKLTDTQLRLVQDHARAVPHVWRSRYLESVADQLMPPTPIDDESVRAAINRTLQKFPPSE